MAATAHPMKAWLSNAAGLKGLTFTDTARPEPGAGEYLVRIEAAALNYSDLLMIRGEYQVKPPVPFVPGQEVCGVIEAAGPDTEMPRSKRVAGKVEWGGFGEYAVLRADMAIAIGQEIAARDAAALPVSYTTALVALECCGALKPGQSVLVHSAAGGLGLAAVQIAHAMNTRVFGTAGSESKQQLVVQHGAEAAFNSRGSDWREQVMAATDGAGVDLVLDTIGGDVTRESIRTLRYGGTVLIAGFLSGTVAKIEAHRLLLKRARAIGVYWSHDRPEDRDMLADIQNRIPTLYRDGRIRPHIGDVHPLAELPAALGQLDAGTAAGKLIVETS